MEVNLLLEPVGAEAGQGYRKNIPEPKKPQSLPTDHRNTDLLVFPSSWILNNEADQALTS